MAQGILVSTGNTADYTPGSAVSAGDIVEQNSLFGITSQDIAANALGTIITDGIFDVVKVTGAISAGAEIYWDNSADPVGGTAGSGACTSTAASLNIMGWAVESALEAGTTCRVKLANVQGTSVHGALTASIPDGGSESAIPVTSDGYVALLTAGGAEVRTLADPTRSGQQMLLFLITYGTDVVITCASAVNQTGNNTLTFSDIGEVLQLVGIDLGGNVYEWRVVHNDGVVLSTVG